LSRLTLALGVALLVVEIAASAALIAINGRDQSLATTGLQFTACAAFVISGLVALAQRPENRTGVYLAVTGYVWAFGALTLMTNEWLFAIGFVLGDLVWIPFTALVLAYPTGRFASRLERTIPIAAGVLVATTSIFKLLFDPTPAPTRCDDCPGSAILVADQPAISDTVDGLTSVVGLVLIALVVVILYRRWRNATPASRRVLWPVLAVGATTLLAVGLVILADRISDSAARFFQFILFVSFAAMPFAFLFGILRTRLARSSVSQLVVALDRGVPLRDALADALRDPGLEIVYWLDWRRGLGGAGWVDARGHAVGDPASDASHSVRFVERGGERVAAVLYDPALDTEREFVEAVTAAAGMALQNERLQAELRAEVNFMSTVTNTAPSLLVNVGTDGRIRNINIAALRATGLDDEERARGQYFWDVFIDADERVEMKARFHAAAPDFPAAEYENVFTNARGELLVIYWRSAPVHDEHGNVASIVSGGLDITDRKRHEQELRASRARLVAAADEARQELERNLHDGAQQRLVALSVSLRLAESKLAEDPAATSSILAGARQELAQALSELREIARGIHPAVLTDRGLGPAVEGLVARTPVPVEVDVCPGRLPPAVEAASYYVVAEALTNVAKYSNAAGASVEVTREDGHVVIEVTDDGSGGADPARGSGLRGLADRVAALDGVLSVESTVGQGTRVRAEIPLAQE
jgi:PAS domain S-box-containing protein